MLKILLSFLDHWYPCILLVKWKINKQLKLKAALCTDYEFDFCVLILFSHVPGWKGHITDLSSNRNNLNTLRVNCILLSLNKLSNDAQVDRLCTCGSLCMLKKLSNDTHVDRRCFCGSLAMYV